MTPHERYVVALLRDRGYGARGAADILGIDYEHTYARATPEELELVRALWDGGNTVATIARATGRAENAVRYQLRRMGLLR